MQNVYCLGDFGDDTVGVRALAAAMQAHSDDEGPPLAVLALGDNFYPTGMRHPLLFYKFS